MSVLQGSAGPSAGRRIARRVGRRDIGHSLDKEALLIDGKEAAAGLGLRQTVFDHGPEQKRRDPATGRAHTQNSDAASGCPPQSGARRR